MNSENIHTDAECTGLLQKLFDAYPAFLKTILPDSWRNSVYVNFFHPTAQQQYEEQKKVQENLKHLSKKKNDEKENLLSDFKQDFSNLDEKEEPNTLLGLCLWDIFSNNHSVIDSEGKEYDLGSFRGCAGFIADFLNVKKSEDDSVLNFDYMEFYMGTIWIRSRGNLGPFYEFIFTVLKNEGCDWKYSFPRMHLFKFESDEVTSPEEYDASEAMEQELKEKEIDEFQKALDDDYEKTLEEAKYKKPPETVLAYLKVYREFPEGHPQKYL